MSSFASSYIKTSTVAVTRYADVLTYPTAGNALGTVGAFYLEFTKTSSVIPSVNVYLCDLGTNAAPCLVSINLQVYDGTTTRSFGIAMDYSGSKKIATTWGGSTCNGAMNGVSGTAAAFDGDLNAGVNTSIGAFSAASAQPFGNIKNVRIWQRQLSATQLAAITT